MNDTLTVHCVAGCLRSN